MDPLVNTLIICFLQLSLSQDLSPQWEANSIIVQQAQAQIQSQTPTPTTPTPTTPSPSISRLLFQAPPCSNNVECITSPCNYLSCPAYPRAICREWNCGGCTAIFLDHITGAQLSPGQCNPPHTRQNTTAEPEEVAGGGGGWEEGGGGGEEGYEYEYPQQVDQYQKTRDNYGVNLNDEMIDIGRDLINYGDLDINVAWPYDLQSVSNSLHQVDASACDTNENDTNILPCITVNGSNGTTLYYQLRSTEEIGDDPVVNDYTIDNVQKTRDNMGLNLNDEVVDIGRDLINYGTLHYNMVPVSPHSSPLTASNAVDPEGINNYKVLKVDDPTLTIPKSTPSPNETPTIGCPPDEKICPDGTVVFRELMNYCQFAPCPIPTPSAPQLVPQTQSAKQTDQNQLTPIITPCIAKGDRSDNKQCGQDMDCCGDGICDINRRCVHTPSNIGNNNINNNELFNNNELEMMENDNKSEINQMTRKIIIIIVVLLVIVLCVILPLLYWFYCKKCTLPTTKVEARREILNEIQISHNNGDNDK
mmetsp:Transcript_34223/g.30035  ORF Transcript_34223/g.30035 Transcript_34223/m.30035 type:complete len:531 (-) Transcript_34223:109-1701(-)